MSGRRSTGTLDDPAICTDVGGPAVAVVAVVTVVAVMVVVDTDLRAWSRRWVHLYHTLDAACDTFTVTVTALPAVG
jgi:hypothetical protein